MHAEANSETIKAYALETKTVYGQIHELKKKLETDDTPKFKECKDATPNLLLGDGKTRIYCVLSARAYKLKAAFAGFDLGCHVDYDYGHFSLRHRFDKVDGEFSYLMHNVRLIIVNPFQVFKNDPGLSGLIIENYNLALPTNGYLVCNSSPKDSFWLVPILINSCPDVEFVITPYDCLYINRINHNRIKYMSTGWKYLPDGFGCVFDKILTTEYSGIKYHNCITDFYSYFRARNIFRTPDDVVPLTRVTKPDRLDSRDEFFTAIERFFDLKSGVNYYLSSPLNERYTLHENVKHLFLFERYNGSLFLKKLEKATNVKHLYLDSTQDSPLLTPLVDEENNTVQYSDIIVKALKALEAGSQSSKLKSSTLRRLSSIRSSTATSPTDETNKPVKLETFSLILPSNLILDLIFTINSIFTKLSVLKKLKSLRILVDDAPKEMSLGSICNEVSTKQEIFLDAHKFLELKSLMFHSKVHKISCITWPSTLTRLSINYYPPSIRTETLGQILEFTYNFDFIKEDYGPLLVHLAAMTSLKLLSIVGEIIPFDINAWKIFLSVISLKTTLKRLVVAEKQLILPLSYYSLLKEDIQTEAKLGRLIDLGPEPRLKTKVLSKLAFIDWLSIATPCPIIINTQFDMITFHIDGYLFLDTETNHVLEIVHSKCYQFRFENEFVIKYIVIDSFSMFNACMGVEFHPDLRETVTEDTQTITFPGFMNRLVRTPMFKPEVVTIINKNHDPLPYGTIYQRKHAFMLLFAFGNIRLIRGALRPIDMEFIMRCVYILNKRGVHVHVIGDSIYDHYVIEDLLIEKMIRSVEANLLTFDTYWEVKYNNEVINVSSKNMGRIYAARSIEKKPLREIIKLFASFDVTLMTGPYVALSRKP